MDKLIITIAGLGSIGGIFWFFFGKKSGDSGSTQENTRDFWDILVDGGYKPNTIRIPSGKPSTVTFIRKDPNSCLEEVVIPDFKIKTFLPINEPITISLSPTKPGTFDLHCGMNMFHGKIIVI